MNTIIVVGFSIMLTVVSLKFVNAQKSSIIKSEIATYTDQRDGYTYETIKIGNQVWFAENLIYKHSTGSFIYENNENNLLKYGRLYTYRAAVESCPFGWHIPTKNEFDTLLLYVGGAGKIAYNSLIEGGDSKFSAIPSGYCENFHKTFFGKDISAYFLTSPILLDNRTEFIWILNISGVYEKTQYAGIPISGRAFSVRCLKDN